MELHRVGKGKVVEMRQFEYVVPEVGRGGQWHSILKCVQGNFDLVMVDLI